MRSAITVLTTISSFRKEMMSQNAALAPLSLVAASFAGLPTCAAILA
jgi:hypothetical protein